MACCCNWSISCYCCDAYNKDSSPSGGATALIAVIGGEKIHSLGFIYALVPAGAGAIVLLIVALIVNNLSNNRKYPEYWFLNLVLIDYLIRAFWLVQDLSLIPEPIPDYAGTRLRRIPDERE